MLPPTFRGYLVTKGAGGKVSAAVAPRPLGDLPEGDVLIRVAYSSLNYKDALAAKGHPGVAKTLPHIPGVDAAGVVAESGVYEYVPGDQVLVHAYDLGAGRWGGLAEYVRVPQDWIVPLPAGLTLRESMILGTAGFTAALSVDALQKHGVLPGSGEVLVTGASGGVGTFAVSILARLGYQVVAVTGKPAAHEFLRQRGATRILARDEVDDRGDKPLLSGRWAGAVDCVGGNILATILRSTRYGGCVTACGLTAGNDLSLTVFPFILRAVTLAGIDAAWCPGPLRHEIWQRLAGPWKPPELESIVRQVELEDVHEPIEAMLAGQVTGRILVKIGGEEVLEAPSINGE